MAAVFDDLAKMLVATSFGRLIAACQNHRHCFFMMNNYHRKIFKYKRYAHFDSRKSPSSWIEYISDPMKIIHHGFYPFIHFTLKTWKYDNSKKDTKTKPREINYSSHVDRYIYEYYNHLLNENYNLYAKRNRINQCAVAYRNNLHQNNITIAKEVFKFIEINDDLIIVISDFTKYFDNINHAYLKDRLKEVLDVVKLKEDWYKVFRSVTRFSYIDLEKIVQDSGKTTREIRKLKRIDDLHLFKKFITINKNSFGLPQGSSISSTLSNVNLINYDSDINDFVTSKNGLYRRYCDDAIIILPRSFEKKFFKFYEEVNSSVPGIEVNKDKIQKYYFKDHKILDTNMNKTWLKYLGFQFNGNIRRIREKTVTAFYLKAYRVIKGLRFVDKKFGRTAYRKKFYQNFTHLGKRISKKRIGNFLSYVDRSAAIMKDQGIKRQLSKHWIRFNRSLKETT